MARSDQELIDEARALTGYDDGAMFTDTDMEALLSLSKEEIRSSLGAPGFEFYRRDEVNTLDADRALFWFLCIGAKIRAGEIGSVELTVDNLEEQTREGQFNVWFSNFQQRMAAAQAGVTGAATTTISRTDRTYEYDQPELGDSQ
jgi:hypothetical protein